MTICIKEQFKTVVKDIKIALIWNFLSSFLMFFGFLEAILYFFKNIEIPQTPKTFFVLGLFSLSYTILQNIRKHKISFYINNSEVTIFFGDIFKQKGIIAIPVNNYIDTELTTKVSPTSLHGQFIEKIAKGSDNCDKVLEMELHKNSKNLNSIRSTGLQIGTIIPIQLENHMYLLSVLSKTNIDNNVAEADLKDLITTLSELLNKARETCNDAPLNIPLFGGGLSKVDLPPQQLLEILLIMIRKVSQQQRVTSKINIVLNKSIFNRITLKSILEGVKDGI